MSFAALVKSTDNSGNSCNMRARFDLSGNDDQNHGEYAGSDCYPAYAADEEAEEPFDAVGLCVVLRVVIPWQEKGCDHSDERHGGEHPRHSLGIANAQPGARIHGVIYRVGLRQASVLSLEMKYMIGPETMAAIPPTK